MEGSSKNRRYDRRTFDDPLDRRISERAADQHGTVSVRQLESLGISASAVRDRVAGGRLHRVHSGVGGGHGARPADTQGLDHGGDPRLPAGHAGLQTRGAVWIAPGTRWMGGRHDAGREGPSPHDVLHRADGRRGAKLLRAVLDEHFVGSTQTRNDLEEAFLKIARAIGHPPDAVNVWIAFPDGSGAEALRLPPAEPHRRSRRPRPPHQPQGASTQTAARDARLMLLGWRVVRFTWQQVEHDPAYVAATQRCWSELRTQPRGRTRSARARRPRCAPARSRSSPPRARASPCPARSRGPRSSRRPCR